MTLPALGGQTLTFLSASAGPLDRKNIPVNVYSPTVVGGCSIQPVSVTEDVTNIDYAIAKFRAYAPPVPAALALKVTDYVLGWASTITRPGLQLGGYVQDATDGVYRVFGTKIWSGLDGLPNHVTVFLETPSGLPNA